MMYIKNFRKLNSVLLLSALLMFAGMGTGQAKIDGLEGVTTFNFTAKAGHITTGEGNTVLFWGYADDGGHQGSLSGQAQYPGPTIIINAGESITINLTNHLPQATSMLFPGADVVNATGNIAGTLTMEAAFANGTAQYQVTYNQPGTYTYYSGTNMDLQVEMGLVGAIVVRSGTAGQAYDSADSSYDYETLFLLTDMDPVIHDLVEFGRFDEIDLTKRNAVYWFINGRNGPDTLLDPFVSWLPTQPYNSLPRIRPCENLLLRLVGGGLDGHPFHTHGNNINVIAKDARLLSTDGATADLAFSDFTQSVYPGETYDALFTWTGANMGWDYYGHATEDVETMTACEQQVEADFGPGASSHGLPIPVTLPAISELTFSPFYSGSPYLGGGSFLPPGEGGFNQNGGFYYMWHSHNEKELTNWDIFPGGMLTFLIIEPPSVTIE
ncbi:MAG: multicopper oxidase domain-containing protein [Desulfuromonadales bacterium]|nr:multicopper oxidase domain-containing protein [Desulfuromonadales bacterium]